MDHLGAGVGLLAVVGDRYRVEPADRVIALQDHTRVFPGDGRTGLNLGPGYLGTGAAAGTALGDKVVDAAAPLLVARVPILHGRVLDLGVLEGDELHHGGVQLVLVAHRRRAAFQVADARALVGDDQRALELAGVGGVDAEIGGQLHRAAHALGHVHEGAVAEHRRVERGVEVVAVRHDAAEIFLHQLRIFAYRFRERAEHDAEFGQLCLVGGRDRHRVEHRVHCHAGERRAFMQRNAELFVGFEQLGVDVGEALRPVLVGLGRGEIDDRLIIDRRIVHVRPMRLGHGQPVTVSLQPPLAHKLGFALLRGNQANDVIVQAGRHGVRLELGDKALCVLAPNQRIKAGICGRHRCLRNDRSYSVAVVS